MAEKSLNMEMGNLICRFGNKKVLLDLIEEVVLPCFLDKGLIRRYAQTSYFFHEAELVTFKKENEPSSLGVVGRYIKDTTLESEQIFEDGKGLIKSNDSIRSSPSAIFLLILDNHRLVYVKETKNAPPKESFRTTLQGFLRTKHKQFIDQEYKRLEELREEDPSSKKVTKKSLYESIPRPTLELIPLTSEESIEQFIKKYRLLRTVEIALSDRNDEIDNDDFFEELQKRKDAIGSKKTAIRHNNSKGLNKEEAVSEIADATGQGNQSVKLIGIDDEGDVLRGNNEKFQIRKPLSGLSNELGKAANQLFKSYEGLVKDGLVKVPEVSQKAKMIIGSVIKRLS